MRTIAIEEHFLSAATAEAMKRDSTPTQRTGPSDAVTAKLMDLGEKRLADMDAAGIDVQVISHTASSSAGPLTEAESVRLASLANDQLAAALVIHPTRFG